MDDQNTAFEDYKKAPSEAKLVALLRATEKSIFRVCFKVLGSRADTEDASQFVFLQILENVNRLKNAEHYSRWVYRTSFNIALTHRRSELRRKQREEKASVLMNEPQNTKTQEELSEHIQEHISKLDEDLQTLLIAYYFDEKTQTELSQESGYSLGSISNKLKKAKNLLLQSLKAAGYSTSAIALNSILETKLNAEVPQFEMSDLVIKRATEIAAEASLQTGAAIISKGALLKLLAIGSASLIAIATYSLLSEEQTPKEENSSPPIQEVVQQKSPLVEKQKAKKTTSKKTDEEQAEAAIAAMAASIKDALLTVDPYERFGKLTQLAEEHAHENYWHAFKANTRSFQLINALKEEELPPPLTKRNLLSVLSEIYYSKILSTWAEKHPNNALKFLEGLDPKKQKRSFTKMLPGLVKRKPWRVAEKLEQYEMLGAPEYLYPVAAALIEKNPQKTIAWTQKMGNPFVTQSALENWYQLDEEAFFAWAENIGETEYASLENDIERTLQLGHVKKQLQLKSYESTFDYIQTTLRSENPQLANEANDLVITAWHKNESEVLLDRLPEVIQIDDAEKIIASNIVWTPRQDFVKAVQLYEKATKLNLWSPESKHQERSLTALARYWTILDPSSANDWANAIESDEDYALAIKTVAQTYALSNTEEALEAIQEWPEGPLKKEMLQYIDTLTNNQK